MSCRTPFKFRYWGISLAALPALSAVAEKPNIILIMADDMGFSDLGCYGSEITTPNLDGLAQNGIRYTNFYNGARSCPTRAALMTGLYAHQAGMGWMTAAYEGDGPYQGDLSRNAVTIAEYLKGGGYKTYMTGKWHLSNHRNVNEKIADNWPCQRGFDRYFGIVGGAANYFTPTINSDNKSYKAPADFYLTDAISDSTVAFIGQQNESQPFFMYVAYNAPHWPLQARPADIAKYDGKYDIGWDVLRANRLQKQKGMGLIDDRYTLTPRDKQVNAWTAETKKAEFAKRMQIYAAQIEVMDQGIGRIVQALRDKGMLENTIIMFLSDNGACAEMQSSGASKEVTGAEDTYESYRRHWANASNTPYREYKHFAHEGGIKTPFIVHWPGGITRTTGGYEQSTGHLIDVFRTIEDITGIAYPDIYNGNTIIPLQGQSMLPHFKGIPTQREPVFWEHEGNIAVRQGDWKLVSMPGTGAEAPGKLELYNLANDPTELNDLANSNPQKKQELWDMWLNWAEEKDVYPLNTIKQATREDQEWRYLNGEFNAGMSGWTFKTTGTGSAGCNLNKSNEISGTYSAQINVTQTGEKPNNIIFFWPLDLQSGERCKIRFKAKSDRPVAMLLRLEKNSGNYSKVIDESIDITEQITTYEYDSSVVPAGEEYRIGFYFGSSVPSTVWLDAVELIFINEPALSPTWDFKSIAGASYAVTFKGSAAQLKTPVTVSLKKAGNPQEVCFSQVVNLRKTKQDFRLELPSPAGDEKMFIQFEYPVYATQDCLIEQLNLEVNEGSSLEDTGLAALYRIEKTGYQTVRIIAIGSDRLFRAELFDLNGNRIDDRNGQAGAITLYAFASGTYIVRISEEKEIISVKKIVL